MLRFFNKKAAVFGIDARISLILISIASLAIVLSKQAALESSRLQDINIRLLEAEDAILEDYKKNYKSAIFLSTDYSSMSDTQKHQLWQGRTELYTDPWGNEWGLKAFISSDATLMAFGEKIEPICVVLFSAGADGFHDKLDNYSASDYDDCINNVDLDYDETETEINDDYFYKFTSIGYEIEINEDVATRLDAIKNALFAYANAKKNSRRNFCNGLAQVDADANINCDVDTSGTYEEAELDEINYYPQSSTDSTAAVYYSSTVYDTTSITDLENLMTEIGLSTTYAKDLAGRRLNYNSNSTDSTTGDYYAEFYYKVI